MRIRDSFRTSYSPFTSANKIMDDADGVKHSACPIHTYYFCVLYNFCRTGLTNFTFAFLLYK